MERTVAIKGTAKISVFPDYTTLIVRLREKEKNYKKALEKLQKKSAEIRKCVEENDIESTQIKTNEFSASPLRKMERDRKGNFTQIDDGYECRQSILISFDSDSILLGELINSISDKIDNPDISITFSIKDLSKYKQRLMNLIIEDAWNKANAFCEFSNSKVGKLISANYNNNDLWSFSPRSLNQNTAVLPPIPFKPPMASSAPTMPTSDFLRTDDTTFLMGNNSSTILNNINPQERNIEESATFVWEIID